MQLPSKGIMNNALANTFHNVYQEQNRLTLNEMVINQPNVAFFIMKLVFYLSLVNICDRKIH